MVTAVTRTDTVHMRIFAEELALRAVEIVTTPLGLAGAAVILIAVFTGLGGRAVLYLQTLPVRLTSEER